MLVFAMHILHVHKIGAKSLYTMKYLALAAAMQLSANTQTVHATGWNAKSVLNNITRNAEYTYRSPFPITVLRRGHSSRIPYIKSCEVIH